MSKIILISPGSSIMHYGLMLQKSLAHPEDLLIVNACMEDALDYVRCHLPEDADVIIARGNTAALLKSAHLSIPIVTIPIHDSELIHSIYTAKELYQQEDSKIAYLGLEDVIQSVRGFLDILHCNIRLYPISSSKDIRKSIQQAKKDQIHVVIGGVYTQKEALAAGLHCVLLESSLSSVKEAYERALEVQKGFVLQRKKMKERTIILDSIADGILSVNEKGKITVCNPAAEQLLNIAADSVIGKSCAALFSQTEKELIQQSLISGRPVSDHIFGIKEQDFSLSVRPILVGPKNKGLILTIRPLRTHVFPASLPADRNGMLPSARSFFELTGSHPIFRTAVSCGLHYAKSSAPVLIIGESGTGKETLAHCIHQAGERCKKLFVSREASFLSIEDMLAAHGGTLYIRNGQNLSPLMQELLTDVLKTGSVTMDNHIRQDVSIRLMIGSEADLSSIFTPRFYYLVNSLILPVPALRHRASDIPALAEHMLKSLNKQYGKHCNATPEFLHELEQFPWPGNLQQLESYLRRLVILSSGETALSLSSLEEFGSPDDSGFYVHLDGNGALADFPPAASSIEPKFSFMIKGRNVSYSELQALDRYYHGKKGLIAEKLGISRSTLWRYYKDMEAAGWKPDKPDKSSLL